MTSNSKAQGRFGKQGFRYVAQQDVYMCPAGERLAYHYTTEENGLVLRRYWTNACRSCAIKHSCTTGKERRIGEPTAVPTSAAILNAIHDAVGVRVTSLPATSERC
jgi:hypothetical protein